MITSISIHFRKNTNTGMIEDAAASDFFSAQGHLDHALTDLGRSYGESQKFHGPVEQSLEKSDAFR